MAGRERAVKLRFRGCGDRGERGVVTGGMVYKNREREGCSDRKGLKEGRKVVDTEGQGSSALFLTL